MKRKFLYVFALSAGLFSLASCQGTPGIQGEQGIQGEKGDKGDKGETGATGAKGETGENGKDGIDGKDGASLLTGDGAPKNTLGNDGDTYLDLKTYDLYKKVEGEWVKEGNIKGSNGYNASNYYSSTILPSDYGYVVPSKGSATYGESITYTVYVEDTEKVSKALQLFVDGKAVKLDKVNDTTYAYETTMKQNGHVVQAKFYDNTSLGNNITNGGEYVLLGDANLSTAGKFTTRFSTLSRFKTFRQAYGTINVSNSLGINLNGKTLDLGSNSLVIENGADFALTSSSDEEGTKGTLVSSGDNVIEIKANDNSKSSVSIDSGTKISSTSTSSSASAIKVEGGEIEIKGEVSSNYGTALSVSGGKAEINGSISSTNGSAIVISRGKAEVKEEANVESVSGTTIEVKEEGSLSVSGNVKSTAGTAIKQSGASASVSVKTGSEISGATNGIEVKGGTLSVSGGTISGEKAISASHEAGNTDAINVNLTGGNYEAFSGEAIDIETGEHTKSTLPSGGVTKTTYFSSGEGTSSSPYIINSIDELKKLKSYYNIAKDKYTYIKLDSAAFADGIDCAVNEIYYFDFNGEFDGNNVKFKNLTKPLFKTIGNGNVAIESKPVKIKNVDATMKQNGGSLGLVFSVKTNYLTFDNVAIHGTIEGDANVGAFYQYGTYNYIENGCDYTVNFANCKCDALIISRENGTAGILAGHTYAGNNVATLKLDSATLSGIKTAKMRLKSSSGSRLFFGIKWAKEMKVYVGDTLQTNNEAQLDASNVSTFGVVNPVKAESGAFNVTKGQASDSTKATKVKIYLKSQVSAWNNNSQVTGENGITASYSGVQYKEFEADNDILEVFKKIEHIKFIKNENANLISSYDETTKTLYLSYNFNSNYKYTGTVKLAISQYDSNDNFIAAGDILVGQVAENSSSAIDPYNTEWTLA